MRKRPGIVGWSVAGLVALVMPFAAAAQNLLANGGFDGGLEPWTTFNDVSHSADDAGGSASSGSARLLAVDQHLANLAQCVALPAAAAAALQLDFSMKALPATAERYVRFYFEFHTQPGCASPLATRTVHLAVEDTSGWIRLSEAATVPAGSQSLRLVVSLNLNAPTGTAEVRFDDLRLEPVAALLLNHDRFLVTADWQTADAAGHGTGVELAADSGYFWFFSPSNVELIVKVLDGCSLNDHYWVFAGGLTNVEVRLHVIDTQTLLDKTYVNPPDTAFQPLQDTNALPTCP